MTDNLARLFADHLAQAGAGISIGCFGALAEFQDAHASLEWAPERGAFSAQSVRGAFSIACRGDVAALAYEALAAADDAWQCGIAITADRRRLSGPARKVLTELGPDHDAIRASERGDTLFDLGVGMANVDYCVRTAEPALIAFLRGHCGERVAQRGHAVLDRMIDASPHRVALSAAGRIEVYQRIDRHRTPAGPHTHLLPDLLARGRTHSANIPLPSGTMPVLTLHPPHPLQDELGQRRAFDRGAYARFEALLHAHGLPAYVAEKVRLRTAIATGLAPADYQPPRSRSGRLAMRIALRQLLHAPLPGDGAAAWLAHFRR